MVCCHVSFFRCAINSVPEQAAVVATAMEGFLDGLPKNRDDPDAHVQVEAACGGCELTGLIALCAGWELLSSHGTDSCHHAI